MLYLVLHRAVLLRQRYENFWRDHPSRILLMILRPLQEPMPYPQALLPVPYRRISHHPQTIVVPSPYQGRFILGFRYEIRTCTRGGTALVRGRSGGRPLIGRAGASIVKHLAPQVSPLSSRSPLGIFIPAHSIVSLSPCPQPMQGSRVPHCPPACTARLANRRIAIRRGKSAPLRTLAP